MNYSKKLQNSIKNHDKTFLNNKIQNFKFVPTHLRFVLLTELSMCQPLIHYEGLVYEGYSAQQYHSQQSQDNLQTSKITC